MAKEFNAVSFLGRWAFAAALGRAGTGMGHTRDRSPCSRRRRKRGYSSDSSARCYRPAPPARSIAADSACGVSADILTNAV